LPSTPWRAGETPVTIEVWHGHVTVGNTGVMRWARAPRAMSPRSAGSSIEGSSTKSARRPSMLSMTRRRSVATANL
jgi:hypothetical protein